MGLDMYLSSVKGNWNQERLAKHGMDRRRAYGESSEAGKAFDEKFGFETSNLGYWRKHSDLHGFFEKCYFVLTPPEYQADSFNCEYLVLNKNMVETVVSQAKIQLETGTAFAQARGCFWGESCKEDWVDTIEIFENVLNTFDFENETLLYYAWW